ncbi:MAG: hypothetical protein AAFX85_05485 [Pseudomonadota bacterium]
MSESPPRRSDDLAALRAVWQARPERVDVDVAALERTLGRRQRHMRMMMVGDVVGTVLAIAMVAWLALTGSPTTRVLWWGGFVCLVAIAAMVASIGVRRPVWSVTDEAQAGVDALIAASIRQARAALGIVRITYAAIVCCYAFLVVWAVTEFTSVEPPTGDDLRKRLWSYGFAIVYGGAIAAFAAVMARRKRAEIRRWQEMRSALAQEEG